MDKNPYEAGMMNNNMDPSQMNAMYLQQQQQQQQQQPQQPSSSTLNHLLSTPSAYSHLYNQPQQNPPGLGQFPSNMRSSGMPMYPSGAPQSMPMMMPGFQQNAPHGQQQHSRNPYAATPGGSADDWPPGGNNFGQVPGQAAMGQGMSRPGMPPGFPGTSQDFSPSMGAGQVPVPSQPPSSGGASSGTVKPKKKRNKGAGAGDAGGSAPQAQPVVQQVPRASAQQLQQQVLQQMQQGQGHLGSKKSKHQPGGGLETAGAPTSYEFYQRQIQPGTGVPGHPGYPFARPPGPPGPVHLQPGMAEGEQPAYSMGEQQQMQVSSFPAPGHGHNVDPMGLSRPAPSSPAPSSDSASGGGYFSPHQQQMPNMQQFGRPGGPAQMFPGESSFQRQAMQQAGAGMDPRFGSAVHTDIAGLSEEPGRSSVNRKSPLSADRTSTASHSQMSESSSADATESSAPSPPKKKRNRTPAATAEGGEGRPPGAPKASVGRPKKEPTGDGEGGPSAPAPLSKTVTEKLNQLYEMGEEPDRRGLLDHLIKFLEESGSPIANVPVISKVSLDLYKFYKYVQSRGGFLEVQKSKGWKDLATYLGISAPNPNTAYTLKKQYIKFILPYEARFDRGGVDPESLVLAAEAMSSRSPARNQSGGPPTPRKRNRSTAATAAKEEEMAENVPPPQHMQQSMYGTERNPAMFNQPGVPGYGPPEPAGPPAGYGGVPPGTDVMGPGSVGYWPNQGPGQTSGQNETFMDSAQNEYTPQPRQDAAMHGAGGARMYRAHGQPGQFPTGEYQSGHLAGSADGGGSAGQPGAGEVQTAGHGPYGDGQNQPQVQHSYPAQMQDRNPQMHGFAGFPGFAVGSQGHPPPRVHLPDRDGRSAMAHGVSGHPPGMMVQAHLGGPGRPRQPPPSHIQPAAGSEIVFPPDSVEATEIVARNRFKLTVRESGPLDMWKLHMRMKSGLLAESGWAFEMLNIYSSEEQYAGQFKLSNLPAGFLDTILDWFEVAMNRLLPERADQSHPEPRVNMQPDSDGLSRDFCYFETHFVGHQFPAGENQENREEAVRTAHMRKKSVVSLGESNDANFPEIPFMNLVSECDEEIGRKCVAVSTCVRNLSAIHGNEPILGRNHRLLRLLGRLILFNHSHEAYRFEDPNAESSGENDDDNTVAVPTCDFTSGGQWWQHYVEHVHENVLVTLANIAGHMDLGETEECICRPILEGLIHWAVCPSFVAQDTLPTVCQHLAGDLSAKCLALEALSKMTVNEANIDLLIAAPSGPELVRFVHLLIQHLPPSSHTPGIVGLSGIGTGWQSSWTNQLVREFALVVLCGLVGCDERVGNIVAEHPLAAEYLVMLLEEYNRWAKTGGNKGMQQLQQLVTGESGDPNSGLNVMMLRKTVEILMCLAETGETKASVLCKYQMRLWNLITESKLPDSTTLSGITKILYVLSLSEKKAMHSLSDTAPRVDREGSVRAEERQEITV